MSTFEQLPSNLPVPNDDGLCNHLLGMQLPDMELPATDNSRINLTHFQEYVVLYCYPMTGKPNVALPDGWDQIPGARGCTPQACSFRDHYREIEKLQAVVFGISTQNTEYQQEAQQRLHLPYQLLSDSELKFTKALSLPVFEVEDMVLNKRLTLITRNGKIVKYFYPVFPPDKNADEVIQWLKENQKTK